MIMWIIYLSLQSKIHVAHSPVATAAYQILNARQEGKKSITLIVNFNIPH